MAEKTVIAVDLGAESGRVMRIGFDGSRLALTETHRFPNIPVQVGAALHWDVLRLWHDIQTGIASVKAADGSPSAGIGVDAWGVDFALLDRRGGLLANPIHYRDRSSEGMTEWVFGRIPPHDLYARTGTQIMPVNTIWRMAHLAKTGSPLLEHAQTYLTIADLFNRWLVGADGSADAWAACEYTHATTTGFFNAHSRAWDAATLDALGIPTAIFPAIVQPGACIGAYQGVPVFTVASHDTGSAFVGVPSTGEHAAILSSGTWSLLGLEIDQPILTEAAFHANLTNEGGYGGTIRFLKNIAGMWLLQQCRAAWKAAVPDDKPLEYAELTALAEASAPFRTLIDPDDPAFVFPGDMPGRIRAHAGINGEPPPETAGEFTRCIYESLAFKYRWVLELLMQVSGRAVETIYVIGGGSRNAVLNQMTADATGRRVVAGPAEATALGCGIVQLIALGEMGSLAEARAILAAGDEIATYEPRHAQTARWDAEYARFRRIIGQG
ncbi:MAG: rhamnulokinase family protein [bacterium]|nr:rhamnulokinase family protein [bacterium]